MTTEKMEELSVRALKCWGREDQLCKVVEELAELQKAVSKVHRDPCGDTWCDVAEEIADVTIMLAQLREMGSRYMSSFFDEQFFDAHINYVTHKKLDRLESLIERYENDKMWGE